MCIHLGQKREVCMRPSEPRGEVIVDVYLEIKRMCDAALRNEIKDRGNTPC